MLRRNSSVLYIPLLSLLIYLQLFNILSWRLPVILCPSSICPSSFFHLSLLSQLFLRSHWAHFSQIWCQASTGLGTTVYSNGSGPLTKTAIRAIYSVNEKKSCPESVMWWSRYCTCSILECLENYWS